MPSIPGIIRSSKIKDVSGVTRSRKVAGSLVVPQFSPIVLASAETSSQTVLSSSMTRTLVAFAIASPGSAGKSLVGLSVQQGEKWKVKGQSARPMPSVA